MARVYVGDCDWYVARDFDHLREVVVEHIGESDWDPDEWTELFADSPLTLWEPDDGDHPEGATVDRSKPPLDSENEVQVTATCDAWAKWALERGRTYLASTEW